MMQDKLHVLERIASGSRTSRRVQTNQSGCAPGYQPGSLHLAVYRSYWRDAGTKKERKPAVLPPLPVNTNFTSVPATTPDTIRFAAKVGGRVRWLTGNRGDRTAQDRPNRLHRGGPAVIIHGATCTAGRGKEELSAMRELSTNPVRLLHSPFRLLLPADCTQAPVAGDGFPWTACELIPAARAPHPVTLNAEHVLDARVERIRDLVDQIFIEDARRHLFVKL